jgi:spermidine dehydrogenase
MLRVGLTGGLGSGKSTVAAILRELGAEVIEADELGRALGAGGFDAERDISAITVNRWGHGYAYDLDKLSDPTRNEEFAAASRARLGRISVAGSDAAWTAYAHAAIDEAYRASREVLG